VEAILIAFTGELKWHDTEFLPYDCAGTSASQDDPVLIDIGLSRTYEFIFQLQPDGIFNLNSRCSTFCLRMTPSGLQAGTSSTGTPFCGKLVTKGLIANLNVIESHSRYRKCVIPMRLSWKPAPGSRIKGLYGEIGV